MEQTQNQKREDIYHRKPRLARWQVFTLAVIVVLAFLFLIFYTVYLVTCQGYIPPELASILGTEGADEVKSEISRLLDSKIGQVSLLIGVGALIVGFASLGGMLANLYFAYLSHGYYREVDRIREMYGDVIPAEVDRRFKPVEDRIDKEFGRLKDVIDELTKRAQQSVSYAQLIMMQHKSGASREEELWRRLTTFYAAAEDDDHVRMLALDGIDQLGDRSALPSLEIILTGSYSDPVLTRTAEIIGKLKHGSKDHPLAVKLVKSLLKKLGIHR